MLFIPAINRLSLSHPYPIPLATTFATNYKKLTTMKHILSTLLIAVSLFACKKSENIEPPPDVAPIKSVKQLTASSNDFISYEYDAAGNVTRYVSQWHNGDGGVNRLNNIFEYNGNKLTRFSNDGGYASFSYNGARIEKSDHFATNGRKLSSFLYEFDQAGKLTAVLEQISNPDSDGITETKISYQYYANGNVSKIDFLYKKGTNDPFDLSFSKVFVEYDNKKNPEPDGVAGFFLPGVTLQRNNPVKINNVSPNGAIEGYSRYEYTYNTKGYPESRKHFLAVGSIEQSPVTFQYTY
jgi:hypothetical protein